MRIAPALLSAALALAPVPARATPPAGSDGALPPPTDPVFLVAGDPAPWSGILFDPRDVDRLEAAASEGLRSAPADGGGAECSWVLLGIAVGAGFVLGAAVTIPLVR